MAQGVYWLITDFKTQVNYDISNLDIGFANSFWKSKDIVYCIGQLEKCPKTEREHWQYMVCFEKKKRLAAVKTVLGEVHAQLSRSEAARVYCHKDETSLGRRWEWGTLPIRRNSRLDWDKIWDAAASGSIDEIPSNVRVCHYSSLKKIQMDHMKPEGIEKEVNVYVGPTGLGKSRKAWYEAGMEAYPKAPTTKFWDGYQGQENVVMDEFFGQIEVRFTRVLTS